MATIMRERKLRTRVETRDYQPAAVGGAETVPLFAVEPGERVLSVGYRMLINAAASSQTTITVGDGTDPDGYLTAIDTETATNAEATGAYFTAAGRGKLYTAADTIDAVYAVTTAGATNPKVRIWVTIEREAPA